LISFLDIEKLKITRSKFSKLAIEDFKLLTRKGVDCVEKLEETRLLCRESFYSLLISNTASESDYAHAVNIWQRFFIQTLSEYSDIYLKTDVLLLADIFENFRGMYEKLRSRFRTLLYFARFHVGYNAETYAHKL